MWESEITPEPFKKLALSLSEFKTYAKEMGAVIQDMKALMDLMGFDYVDDLSKQEAIYVGI